MSEELIYNAALDLSVAIEKNSEWAVTKISAGSVFISIIGYLIGASHVEISIIFLLTFFIAEAKYQILQYLRRSERASIFREYPELIEKVGNEIQSLKANKQLWRQLEP